jgi:hypothetical protein
MAAAATLASKTRDSAILCKIQWTLLPFFFILHVIAYFDRIELASPH